MSDKWGVTKIEWWVISDGFQKIKQPGSSFVGPFLRGKWFEIHIVSSRTSWCI